MFDIKADTTKLRSFKVKLYPTEEQKKFFNKQISLYRYVYNWALALEMETYENYKKTGEYPGFLLLRDLESKFKEFQALNPWLYEISNHTAREAMKRLLYAFKKFFAKKQRFPKFKTRKHSNPSFRFRNDPNALYFTDDGYVRIPGLPFGDKVLCKTIHVPYQKGQILYSPCISFDGYNYYLCLTTEDDRSYLLDHEQTEYEDQSIGIDVGIRKFLTLSNGEMYKLPDIHVLQKRKCRQQSRLSKMRNRRITESIRAKTKLEDIPISKNEEKLSYSYYKTRKRITNIKKSYVDQITTHIANMYPKRIVMETLSIQNLMKQHHQAKLLFGSMVKYAYRRLQEKCNDRQIEFVSASCYFPSTKTCSKCGATKTVGSEETYRCPNCGLVIDRDLNAAINLANYVVSK